jgi:hypothetical protein
MLILFLTLACFVLGYATSSFNLFSKVGNFFTAFLYLQNPLPLISVLVVLFGSFGAIYVPVRSIVVAERKRFWEENGGFMGGEEEILCGRRSLVLESLPKAQVRLRNLQNRNVSQSNIS